MKILPFLITASIALTACDKISASKGSVSKAEATSDPVALLKAKAALLDTGKDEIGNKWGGVAYDVRKTDSLVTPFQGFIKGKIVGFSPGIVEDYKVTLAFQSGAWVVQEIEGTYEIQSGLTPLKQELPSGTKTMIQQRLH